MAGIIVSLDQMSARAFGRDPQDIAAAVVAARPSGVLIDLDSSWQALSTAHWLRAHPESCFPIVVHSFGSGVDALGEEGAWLQDPSSPDRFCLKPDSDPAEMLAGMRLRPDWSAARLQVLDSLIATHSRGYGHQLGNHMAAVMLLVGAWRTGAVEEAAALPVLRDLGAAPEAGETPLWQLFRWWAEAKAAAITTPSRRELQPLRADVLLIDDQAETAGWQRVFGVIFGSRLEVARSAQQARNRLKKRPFDLALVDLDLAGTADGLQLIAETRNQHFDLPLIAFTSHDRADMAMAALGTGADAYFTKDTHDPRDRDAAGYFRRFYCLVNAMRRASDPARKAWREFQPLEAWLEALETVRESDHPVYGYLRAGDYFRMGYFFATASSAADAEGNPLADVRYSLFFGGPDLVAWLCLHMALKLFMDRAMRSWDERASTRALLDAYSAGRQDRLDASQWQRLQELADAVWRHGLPSARRPAVELLSPLVNLMKTAKRSERFDLCSVSLPAVTVHPPSLVPSPVGHPERRSAAFAALRARLGEIAPLPHSPRVLVVDDQPWEWLDLLRQMGALPSAVGTGGDPASVVAAILENDTPPRPCVLLDLDWQGDGGRKALKVLECLKRHRPWIPVMVASALKGSLAVHRALYHGASGYFVLGEPADPTEYARSFHALLARIAGLAGPNYPLDLIWTELAGIEEPLRTRFPKRVQDCMDSLRLAIYCWWPDYNPAEAWRFRRLLGWDCGTGGSMLRRMFFSMAFRPVEQLWKDAEMPQPEDRVHAPDAEFARLMRARNNALKRPGLGEFRLTKPADYLNDVFRIVRRLCLDGPEHPGEAR